MSRSRHTEAQIIEALKRIEAGQKTEEVARHYGVSKYTICALGYRPPAPLARAVSASGL